MDTSTTRITIKNLRPPAIIPINFVEEQLLKLEKEIEAIHADRPLHLSLSELYQCVENLCSHSHGSATYSYLYQLIASHCKNKLLPTVLVAPDLLNTLNNVWKTFQTHSKLLRNVFLYLDRTFILENQYLSVINMSMLLFKEVVVTNVLVRQKLTALMLLLIQQDRCKMETTVDRLLLKSLVTMLDTLQIYAEIFEPMFLQESDNFYNYEGVELISLLTISEYLHHVQQRRIDELERVRQYLIPATEKRLIAVLIDKLLTSHLQVILEKGVPELLENRIREDLTLVYNLAALIPKGRTELCHAFSQYLKAKGKEIVVNPANDKHMIQHLIEFKDQIDDVVLQSFDANVQFKQAVRDSFKYFITQRHNKPAQLLAKFVDSSLRRKDLRDEQTESLLNQIMVLFRFVQGKDVFEAFYKRDLAKRLLVGKSSSKDAENSMIVKLKEECGSGFTSGLEGMFRDMSVSQEINAAFRQHLVNIGKETTMIIDMCVNILTSSYWPNYPAYDVRLPHEMIAYQDVFFKFYMAKHSGRKLQWQPNLGHCIVRAQFSHDTKKELQLSLFQTIVLLLFNAADEIAYKEIRETLNLDAIELKRTLQSLACGKARVLLKSPRGKDVDDTDSFIFNGNFTDKFFRVKINQVQMTETEEEQHATEESVKQDRQFQVDAAIVRIMKQKRALSHNLLIAEVYNTLDIPLKATDLKKRIEQLIERDYIERDCTDNSIYNYIA